MINNIPAELRNAAGVYEIKNTVTGDRYIGSTINFYKRYRQHWYLLRKRLHRNSFLSRLFNKYGTETFDFNILREVGRIPGESTAEFGERLVKHELKFYKQAKRQKGRILNLRVPSYGDYKGSGNLSSTKRIRSQEYCAKISKANAGENQAGHILTANDVKEIRLMLAKGVAYPNILPLYDVKPATIYSVINNKTWKSVTVSQQEIDEYTPSVPIEWFGRSFRLDEVKLIKVLLGEGATRPLVAHHTGISQSRIRGLLKFPSYAKVIVDKDEWERIKASIDFELLAKIESEGSFRKRSHFASLFAK